MAEKEYIEREALRNELLKISICTDDLYGMGILEGLDRATRRVSNAPAADVVEVVRCKDCKWCEHFFPEKKIGEEAQETYYCNLIKGNRVANDFCSYGERNEATP